MKDKEELNILYISSVCSENVYRELQSKIANSMHYSIQKFHNLIITGISKNKNVRIEAMSGIPINRKNTKKIIFRKQVSVIDNIKYIHMGFINLPILKQILITIGMIINLLKWNKKNKSNKIIICDAAYVTVTPVIVFISKLLNIKKIAIVADIYDYMSDKLTVSKKLNIYKKAIVKLCNYCWNNYDGFILLTEQMNNIVNPKNKQYIIMEGIAENDEEISDDIIKENYIMYARKPL